MQRAIIGKAALLGTAAAAFMVAWEGPDIVQAGQAIGDFLQHAAVYLIMAAVAGFFARNESDLFTLLQML